MSIKHAIAKIRKASLSDSELIPPRHSLSHFIHGREFVNSSDETSDDNESMSRKELKRQARQQAKSQSRSRLSEDSSIDLARKKERDEQAAKEETEEMRRRYGDLPLMQSQSRFGKILTQFDAITSAMDGQEITFRARIHVIRRMGTKLVFIVFRQQVATLQGVLTETEGEISTLMVQWAEHLRVGSILKVKGVLRKPAIPIIGTTIHDIEVQIKEAHVVVRRDEPVPFSVYEAELPAADEERIEGRRTRVPDRTRLANRILDLRTDTSQSIFRIQSAISSRFRSSLDANGFIEIHTPKLQGAATESGASVFNVNYFNRPAFLAQSPQLAKQMAIAADFERVYEIGAVFRAENSNTHRHLTEYTGLDIEMAIEEHYHESLEILDQTLKSIFAAIYDNYQREVRIIQHQFPSENLVWLDKTPIFTFSECIRMLNESGWRSEDGNELSDLEDLGTRDEIQLGSLIKEKYHTDYYIIDKFPATARPFYAMPDPKDDRFTNSYDIFVRGQEIVSGGQRIHDPELLEQRMKKLGVDPSSMEEYMEGFRWGAPPHAGAGIGLERLLMLILKLGNIRLASMFHRDPKSFPAQDQTTMLRHPEASTLDRPWDNDAKSETSNTPGERKLQDLEELIANYGDSTSTSWFDDRFLIWRDTITGAAVSYVPIHGHAIISGNPLCDVSQYPRIVTQFLRWLKKETKLRPIWLLCSIEVEEILGDKLGWRSLSCVAEERVDPSRNQVVSDGEIARKLRQAEKNGVKITTLKFGQAVPGEIQNKIDIRIQDWLANRKGTQIHLSQITPWRDQRHRQYFYATDHEGKICSFVTLAQLSPRNGMQVKYSFDFPGSPSGSIEYIVTHAIQSAGRTGVKTLTFGGGATAHLTPGHNISSTKAKFLSKTYDTIVRQFKLNRKTEFRAKLGALEDPMYIAYPKHGLGTKGIRAILSFFED
ncbi:aspartate--tRNA ligase dps1 [Ophidiomyces ophidiicola]|nr:aspartate--tRNA ligase dps1 [Ophidiomyces ophidiicola]KAI2053968.1 aspartate--tRNA ligase dps1 [Ophidiomyces ophidiicola]KAI2075022.1 aspartate--tRNA ligase dps1 [Ophidiomyces ophidiicola]KAI2076677.1 aspartate--tRNA ligase dps1 [Ophidiomyces ophidiicola]KAI2093923.1 aspartate--tRNA ligase dps1 [Ophidiomyces ophidiicola]